MINRIFSLMIAVLLIVGSTELSIGQEEDKSSIDKSWKLGLNLGTTQSNLKIHDVKYGQRNGLSLSFVAEKFHTDWIQSELRIGYHRRGADISYFYEDSTGHLNYAHAKYDFNSIDVYTSVKFKLLHQDKWNPYVKVTFGFYKGFDVSFSNTYKVDDDYVTDGGKVNSKSIMWAGGLSFGLQREFGRITLAPEFSWLHDITYLSPLYREFGKDLAENQLFMISLGAYYSLEGKK